MIDLLINHKNMGFLIWIVFGALVGWIASIIMKTNAEQGAILNIIVGIIGAVLGGWLFSFFWRRRSKRLQSLQLHGSFGWCSSAHCRSQSLA